jgi:lipopolysaccharide transport system permease protein
MIDLLLNLTSRDIRQKYQESVIGAAWSILVPLIVLGIYTVIFSTLFHARWEGRPVVNKADYAVLLFIGLITYGIFAETISRAPTVILQQPNFVKKVVFPLEVLPGVVVLSSLYNAGMASVALFAFLCLSSFGLHIQALMFPLILIPYLAFLYGLALIFSSLGIFLRDFDQFAALLARVTIYLSPVLYPSTIFPEPYRSMMKVSPMAVFIEQLRALIAFGQMPDWRQLGWATFWSILTLVIGCYWFGKTRKAFADVI